MNHSYSFVCNVAPHSASTKRTAVSYSSHFAIISGTEFHVVLGEYYLRPSTKRIHRTAVSYSSHFTSISSTKFRFGDYPARMCKG